MDCRKSEDVGKFALRQRKLERIQIVAPSQLQAIGNFAQEVRQSRLRRAPPKPHDPFLLDGGLSCRLQPERSTNRRTINDEPVKLRQRYGKDDGRRQYINRRQRSLEGQFTRIERILGQKDRDDLLTSI